MGAPALVANKTRAMELQAGKPQKKGNRRGPAYAYNVKALRDQEMQIAEQAERNYDRFVARWKTRPPAKECASASTRQGRSKAPGGASSRRAALRHEVARARTTTPNTKALVDLIRRCAAWRDAPSGRSCRRGRPARHHP